jgi:riboflavin synthase
MFTGIVEELGSVAARRDGRLRIEASAVLDDAATGSSIAVNGVPGGPEGTPPSEICTDNHARGGQRCRERERGDGCCLTVVDAPAPELAVRMPAELARYVVEKGSITVDGCSLTVVDALDDGFTVAVIPHTRQVTTLGHRKAGDRVNLEVDLVAKYVERLLDFKEP